MRSLVDLCIRRPVTVSAFYILVAALAAVALARLPVSLLPELQYPALVVWTSFPEATPDRVERAVTLPIEEAVSGVAGVRGVVSRSRLGGSRIDLEFGWERDLDFAFLEVREAIDRLGDRLPSDADRPVVLRLDPSARPILTVAVVADVRGGSLTEVAREVVARRIEQIDGVSRVRVTGGASPEVDVTLDPVRLAQYGLSVEDVSAALDRANTALPGGTVRRGALEYAVSIDGEFRSAQDIAGVRIPQAGSATVRVLDVARVSEGVTPPTGVVRYDGAETLVLLIDSTPSANTVRTAAKVRGALDALDENLPDLSFETITDESVYVKDAINGILQSLLWGGVLSVLVLYVFLRSPRALLAVGAAVPLSLAMTLVVFDLYGVTINLISLSGLALGVGLLVDNSIVVVENAARLRKAGHSSVEAARLGTHQVSGAIFSSTLTTGAVFVPVTFVGGLVGRLFLDQSIAVVVSLACSLVVALTVVPLVVSRGRGAPPPPAPGRVTALYERVIESTLRHRWLTVTLAATVAGGGVVLLSVLPKQVVPTGNFGRLDVEVELPPGTPLAEVDRAATDAVRSASRAVVVRHAFAQIGETDAGLGERRSPHAAHLTLFTDGATADVSQAVQHALAGRGASVRVREAASELEVLLDQGEADLLIDLISDDRTAAREGTADAIARVESASLLYNVQGVDATVLPAYRAEIVRENVSRYRASVQDLSAALRATTRGDEATQLRSVDAERPVVLRTGSREDVESLLDTRVSTAVGLMPARQFIRLYQVELPSALLRVDRAPVVRLSADVREGANLARAVQDVREALASLPRGIRVEVRGANEEFAAASTAILWSLLVSVLLIYLILAAQFESFVLPVVVLASVPLALAGAMASVWVTGQTVNLMSMTGCVVLVGIVVNDAIIKVDLANQYRRLGLSPRRAVLRAGVERLRPIWMTTLTTALGLLPLALGFGAGAELRAPLGIVVVGGLVTATLLTLVVIPSLYTLALSRTSDD